MNPIVINGTVLCDPITGIPRYVYEIVTRLDPLLEGTGLDVRLCYRDDGRPLHLPPLKNIQIVPLKAVKYSYNLVVLPRYLRKHHAFYVGLASCLPELYGDTAHYFDPYDYDVDLDALLAEPVASPEKILEKYSWDKTAAFWLQELKRCARL